MHGSELPDLFLSTLTDDTDVREAGKRQIVEARRALWRLATIDSDLENAGVGELRPAGTHM